MLDTIWNNGYLENYDSTDNTLSYTRQEITYGFTLYFNKPTFIKNVKLVGKVLPVSESGASGQVVTVFFYEDRTSQSFHFSTDGNEVQPSQDINKVIVSAQFSGTNMRSAATMYLCAIRFE